MLSMGAILTYFYPRSPCGERHTNLRRHRGNDDFYPRSPCGERQPAEHHANSQQEFLSTLSLRRATRTYHQYLKDYRFLSTLSLRRATPPYNLMIQHKKNFYPRSPCGERRGQGANNQPEQQISIHALLAESDPVSELRVTSNVHFYPRSPCGERRKARRLKSRRCVISIHALLAESDISVLWMARSHLLFLSTLSLRRATRRHRGNDGSPIHFYPRSPCGERRSTRQIKQTCRAISIHALLAESDCPLR